MAKIPPFTYLKATTPGRYRYPDMSIDNPNYLNTRGYCNSESDNFDNILATLFFVCLGMSGYLLGPGLVAVGYSLLFYLGGVCSHNPRPSRTG